MRNQVLLGRDGSAISEREVVFLRSAFVTVPGDLDAHIRVVQHGKKLTLRNGQHLLTSGDSGRLEGHFPYPAIALPLETKNEFEFPETHLKKRKSVIPEVARILTIGWRGTEEHFLKVWIENGPPRGSTGRC